VVVFADALTWILGPIMLVGVLAAFFGVMLAIAYVWTGIT
jgi:hypothetical protein